MSNPRRANGSRRDSLTRRVRREESVCHLCLQLVDVRLPHGLPGSPEVDEILPVSLGGSPLDRRNVRLAHRWCNRRRSTLPVAVAQRIIAERPPRYAGNGSVTFEPAKRPRTKQSREW